MDESSLEERTALGQFQRNAYWDDRPDNFEEDHDLHEHEPDIRNVKMYRALWEGDGMGLRAWDGRAITIEWGEPDAEGFWSPTFTVTDDGFVRRLQARVRAEPSVVGTIDNCIGIVQQAIDSSEPEAIRENGAREHIIRLLTGYRDAAPSPALTREAPICGPNCEKCGPEVQADSPRSERTAHEALRRVFSLGTVKGAVVVRATPGHLADEVLRELAAQGFSVVRVPPPSSTREETQ